MCDSYDGPDEDDYPVSSGPVSPPQPTGNSSNVAVGAQSKKPRTTVRTVPAGYDSPTQ